MKFFSWRIPGTDYHSVEFELKKAAYGIRIGGSSEIDQCAVVFPTSIEPKYWVAEAVSSQNNNNVNNNSAAQPATTFVPIDVLPESGVIKVSVARPHLGYLPAGKYRVFWTRRCSHLAFDDGALSRAASLSLEVCESESECLWMPTSRAPWDADFDITANASETCDLWFPVMGRRIFTFDMLLMDTGAGSAGITWQLDAFIEWNGNGESNPIQTALVASTTTTVDGTVLSYDADVGPVDWVRLRFTAGGANDPRAVGHFRAED